MHIKKSSSPLLTQPQGIRNLTDLLIQKLHQTPEQIAFKVLTAEGHQAITFKEFFAQADLIIDHLLASGVKAKDTVAIMAPTRYEWTLFDVSLMMIGAVVVPIYDTNSLSQVQAIVKDANISHAICNDDSHALKILAALVQDDEQADLKSKIWTIEPSQNGFTELKFLLQNPVANPLAASEKEALRQSAELDEVATIVYTSGTTNDPKGVLLTHRNLVTQAQNMSTKYPEFFYAAGSTIMFLPLSHVLARTAQFICFIVGMEVTHLSDRRKIIETFSSLPPTFLLVVPRVLEKILHSVENKAATKGLSRVWARASKIAKRVGLAKIAAQNYEDAIEPGKNHPSDVSWLLKLEHQLWDRIFYRKIRQTLGGNLDYILCGGARLHPDILLSFWGFGVSLLEGFGLTESTAPLSGHAPGHIRLGTVGKAMPGFEIKISDENEILVAGPAVSPGYKNPEQTKSSRVDGYLKTGDMGVLDADGYLRLTGRLKEVVTTSSGKTVSPVGWETELELHPNVAYAVVVGEGRAYLNAIIITQDMSEDSEELSKITKEILAKAREANQEVSKAEEVKRIIFTEIDLEDPRLITPSLKLKRQVFVDDHSEIVDLLYQKNLAPQVLAVSEKF